MTLYARHGSHGPSELHRLRAEIERLTASRDECERQFQQKVEELGREVETTNRLRKALTEARDTAKLDGLNEWVKFFNRALGIGEQKVPADGK